MVQIGSRENSYEVRPWTALHAGKSVLTVTFVISAAWLLFADGYLAAIGLISGFVLAPFWSIVTWLRIGSNRVEISDGQVTFRKRNRVVFQRAIDEETRLEVYGHESQPLLEYFSVAYPMFAYIALADNPTIEIEILVRGERELRKVQEALDRSLAHAKALILSEE